MNARKFLPFVLAVLGLVFVAPAQAQDSPVPSDGTMGFGISVTDALFPGQQVDLSQLGGLLGGTGQQQVQLSPPNAVTVLVPYTTPEYRVEPRVSFGRSGSDAGSASQFGLGGGFFTYLETSEDALLYYGGRVNLDLISVSPDQGEGDSTVNFLLGPVAGLDYYISDHFSIGAEVELTYHSKDNQPNTWRTGGNAFLRAHF